MAADDFFDPGYWAVDFFGGDFWGDTAGGTGSTSVVEWAGRRRVKGRGDAVTPTVADDDTAFWLKVGKRRLADQLDQYAKREEDDRRQENIRQAAERKRLAAEAEAQKSEALRIAQAAIAKARRRAQREAALRAEGRDEATIEKFIEEWMKQDVLIALTAVVKIAEHLGINLDSLGANADVQSLLKGAISLASGSTPEEETVG